MRRMYFASVFSALTILSFCGWTSAVDTANGERVGGCPSPEVIIGLTGRPVSSACAVDTDCTGNPVHKCCVEQNTGFKVCVDPIPACRDGNRIDPSDVLDGTCAELAGMHCLDRGCEAGPPGAGGWKAACCGGYAYEWIPDVPRPTCGSGVPPITDSEGEMYWCGGHSVRPCPGNSMCVTDTGGYQICCPATAQHNTVCTPGEYYSEHGNPCNMCECGPDGRPTDDCLVVDCVNPECPSGKVPKMKPDKCCEYDCIDQDDCSTTACVAGFPACAQGTTLETRTPPGACCPIYRCVSPAEANTWVKDGELTDVSIILIALAFIIIAAAVVAAVAYCLCKRKQQQQQFDNLAYVDVSNNVIKSNKEKEAFQNL